jgi:hypothetical protein
MALTYRTVVGTYLNIDGTPKQGLIKFTPNSDLALSGTAIIPMSSIEVTLDANGSFSQSLACTDSAGVTPASWKWVVDEKFEGGKTWECSIVIGVGSLYLSTFYTP